MKSGFSDDPGDLFHLNIGIPAEIRNISAVVFIGKNESDIISVFGESILSMLPPARDPLGIFLSEIIDLRFLLMLVLQTGLFTAMFTVLPNRRGRLRESLPGAVLACLGWMIFTRLFSFYVEHFSSYSNIYGSVYAVALSMLWLYCCLSIVFYGGALNKLLMIPKE
jgi:membrane protein